MQDEAPPHYAVTARDYLNSTFTPARVISRGCEHPWPAHSPDLTPLDYWFWPTLKARVFHHNPPETINQLKARIEEECDRFTNEEMIAAISNLPRRLEIILEVDGGHFEHLM